MNIFFSSFRLKVGSASVCFSSRIRICIFFQPDPDPWKKMSNSHPWYPVSGLVSKPNIRAIPDSYYLFLNCIKWVETSWTYSTTTLMQAGQTENIYLVSFFYLIFFQCCGVLESLPLINIFFIQILSKRTLPRNRKCFNFFSSALAKF